ncbi:3-beta hydroxysteroid dehydrogenase/isomerase family protein [Didymella exigua CBS 183.55]|uniref:3-beta hydroxysteroid dehydrogenase/isomerase family protein n=1 Tax=Didymella exigua CBS 183.55 TaxID=1150837 RepID=A0A6A5REF2_9PLEO|nr:3-beta hydroxysteroid dehydrogenase/isomerase family protein [Didymella exigua CBS 183.55]KAF1925690.1 3-beta hydroxysteroid dehydrogenase/isomerase family protein [Didymella exigua CBS 183.55]
MASGKALVAITGANGTIGYACVVYALQTGYRVRCIVRREAAIAIIKSGPSVQPHLDDIEYAVVPDNAVEGAYDKALADAQYVVHIAGVWPLLTLHPDNEIYHPFMQSMKNIIASAKSSGSVKRIVFTQAGAGLVDSEVGDTYGRGMENILNESVRVNAKSLTYLPPLSSPHQAYCAAKAQSMDYLDKLRQDNTLPFSFAQVIPGTVIGTSEFVKTAEQAKKHMDRQTRALIFDDNTPRYAFGFVHVEDCARVHIEALDQIKVPDADLPPRYVAAASTEAGLGGSQVWYKAASMVDSRFASEIKKGLFRVGKERTPTNMPYRVHSKVTEKMLLNGEAFRGLEESVEEVAEWYARLAPKEHANSGTWSTCVR